MFNFKKILFSLVETGFINRIVKDNHQIFTIYIY